MPGIGQRGGSPAPQAEGLGVIISLPPALAAGLGARRADFGGAAAALVPPHITLVSGRASGPWDLAAAHVRGVAAATAPFQISLRGTGTFEPVSPVVFLNVVDGAQQCTALHRELLRGPIEHLLDYDFHPHLTMAHDLNAAAMERAKTQMADFAAGFTVASIGLFNHLDGAWALREELALGGAGEV